MTVKKTMKVILVRGLGGRLATHRACVHGLGLRRMYQVVEVEDTPATRGMVRKAAYMVKVVEEASDAPQ